MSPSEKYQDTPIRQRASALVRPEASERADFREGTA